MITAALRTDRRQRLLAAMANDELDVMVLGRPADVAFATGARQLWTAGTRPFGPMCVVVRDTGRTHLLSVSDDGVPPEIAHDDLYGLSWNPANLAASLARVDGLRRARRVGTASSAPGIPPLIRSVARKADVVDGSPAIWAARTPKTDEEVSCIKTAIAIAAAGLAAMAHALRPGVTERQLLAVFLEHIAMEGAPTPPTEAVVNGRAATDRPIEDGEVVGLDAGAFHAGYEGGVGRTWVCGRGRATDERCRSALDAVIAACRAGASGADVRKAWVAIGESLPTAPIAHGVGLGVEPPIIAAGVGDDVTLVAGTVLSVSSWVEGGYFERDLILVGEGEAEVLSRSEP